MKENRLFTVLVAMVVTIILLLSLGMFLNGSGQKRCSVSVVVESDSRWTAFRAGMQQAARDENISVNFVNTGSIASIQQEWKLIGNEVSNGADGIITELRASDGAAEQLAALSRKISVILLNTNAETGGDVDGRFAYVGMDNTAVGKALAAEILRNEGTGSGRCRIGIVAGNQQQYALQERLRAAEEALADCAEVVWVVSGDEQLADMREENGSKRADAILALDDKSLREAVSYVQVTGRRYLSLYGVGCSETLVSALDNGLIRSMLVPEEFNMGYQALISLSDHLNHRDERLQTQVVGFRIVTRATMYEEENQKLLFPTVE